MAGFRLPVRPDSVVDGVALLVLGDDEGVGVGPGFRDHDLAQIVGRVDSNPVDQRRRIERQVDLTA